ncbi:amino acid adenylation domain-containing protein [Phreatobacter aquaticus]|uniref:Amino acid adenylation domain-containing protein n=1 Tax=Phreatobacter aquaticus TaxID=2570229 RepID=A0A4D7QFB3_9HYPH|nr:non-ribosomal peptide synthetase [Phreatobacter aquaticus]QCK84373.1 amino acid adenylation domain-containing protein [Phreatobacter aquaticus]
MTRSATDHRPRPLSGEQQAMLAGRLVAMQSTSRPAGEASIRRVMSDAGGSAPLTTAQRRLWFLDRLSPGHFAYNSPLPLRLTGAVDSDQLETAFRRLIARHAVLRTRFSDQGPEPIQIVEPAIAFDLSRTDLSDLPEAERTARLGECLVRHAQIRFDLAHAPLIAAELVRLGPDDHALLINIHHIVTDGWSTGVLLADLDALYRSEDPAPLQIHYADLAHHEAGLPPEAGQAALDWWRKALADLPLTEIAADRPRPPQQSHEGEAVTLAIAPMQGRLVEALARQHGTSSFVVFLAAFFALLRTYTGQADLAVGSAAANRTRRETEPLIGFFVNTLVMRQTVEPGRSFADLVTAVHRTAMAALDHSETPFDRLVETVNPARDPSRNPLVQVALAVQPDLPARARFGDAEASIMSADYKATRFDIELHLYPDGRGGWQGALTYASALFERAGMERLAARFTLLLANAVMRPQAPVGTLAMIGPREAAELAASSAGPESRPYRSLPDRFATWAAETPHATALEHGQTRITYGELARRVEAMAGALASATPPGAIVAVLGGPSLEQITAVLALWRAGRAFLPLVPDLPEARLRAMVDDARPALILSVGDHPLPADIGQAIVDLESLLGAHEGKAATSPASPASTDLAYVIFTSGTSGRPKGVMIEHGGLANLCDAQQDELIGPTGARVLQFASPGFDAFIFELAMAFANGGALVLPETGGLTDRLQASERIRAGAITHVTLPPSMLTLLRPQEHPSLQTVVVAGEACPAGLDDWASTVRLFNAYGPTEATVWSTVERVTDGAARPPIGRPIRGTSVTSVDDSGAPLPSGIAGEIAIGGVGLARGYVGLTDLTAERFQTDPTGNRIYRTGDRGRRLPDGRIVYLGRTDRQLKRRGHRIEPAEIETLLERHATIAEAAVMLEGDQLVAYVMARARAVIEPDNVRAYLRAHLPAAMMPDQIRQVTHMPRNLSGKRDPAALRAMAPDAGQIATLAGGLPQGETEQRIAAIMAELLGGNAAPAIGRTDDFFALGGHSLLLLQLRNRLSAEFGRDLPLAGLFAAPDVAGITTLLQRGDGGEAADDLLWFRAHGSAPPLFLVHPAIGTSLCYAGLARALPAERPVYGLEAPAAFDTIADLAARYAAAIKARSPGGPYRIGGWSLGGTIAFEMARQMEEAGDKVQLIMIDAGLPWQADGRGSSGGGYVAMVLGLGREIVRSFPRSRADLQDMAALTGASATGGLRAIAATSIELVRRWSCFSALSRAWFGYRPQAYRGPVLILRASADGAASANDPLTATLTPYLSGPVISKTVRAAHLTLLGRKSVQALAEALEQGLSELDRRMS